jgi:uncharacterized protein with HEPN domain
MRKERQETLYIADIRDAIDRILNYTVGGRKAFFMNPMIQDAVVRNIEVIGEAVRGISEPVRNAHPEIPWAKIAGTRDRVIHGYFRVDLDIVWEIVESELATLREKIVTLLPKP